METVTRGAAAPDFDRARMASIGAAIACVSLVGIGLSLSVPLLSLEMERMGVSGALIGVNTATAGLASIVAIPFVPRLAARFGVLPLLWAAVATCTLTLVGFRLVYDFVWWFPIHFAFSAALGTLFVLSEYWINAAAPPAKRGFVMGVYATVLALGFAAGPAILKLVGTVGFAPYVAGAALFAAAALPILLARRYAPGIETASGRTLISFLLAAPAATLAALVFGAVETGAFAILPLYGLRLGYAAESAAFLVSAVALGNVLFQIPIGALSDRVDRRLVLLATAALGTLGAVLMPLATQETYAFVALLVVWGGIVGALYTVGLAHLGARFEGADLVGANAAFVIFYNVGLVIGPPFVGGGMDLMAPHGFALALALLFALYLAVVGARIGTRART